MFCWIDKKFAHKKCRVLKLRRKKTITIIYDVKFDELFSLFISES